MLEFIVLGQVPGTSVQITYAQVLIVAAVLLIAGELRVRSSNNWARDIAKIIDSISL
jgi:hypothetical protein